MGAHVRLAGPDYDEHVALNPQQEEEPPLFYYKDDPSRDARSVRGCFLDEIYAKPRLEQKLADEYFDGDVPFMRDNVQQLSDAQWRSFFEGYLVEPLPRKERKYAVVFYGVSGYTGSLVMEYLKRECLDDVSVCFAGRTLHKVIKMRDKVLAGTRWAQCDCVSCDLKEPFEVEALVSSCRVVCNIAGPFMLTGGERLVEACIHYDTDYCDVSGEIPWSAKLLEFHDVARDAGVYIVPSTAYAGGHSDRAGLPDIMCYAMAKEAREKYDEQLKEFHGYVSMYQEREGTVGASGGTLSTRAAMASGDAWVRKVMTDPFALGGSIDNGQREEDQDRVLTKVFRDGAIKSWVAPHVYAFFETRVVRRSNELHRTLVGGPDKGPFYGEKLNVTVYTLMPSEAAAKEFKKSGSTSTKAEEERLKKEGKYYGPGEGPPLDDLFEIGVYSLYHGVGITESGKKVCWSIKGRDGYFETARMAVEAALAMSESGDELRSGSESVRGGVLTPGIAGKHVLFDRIRAAGMGFIDWSPGTAWDGVKPDDRLGVDVWGNKATPPPVAE